MEKQKRHYYYDGPIYRFERVFVSRWKSGVYAYTPKQAEHLLNMRAKREFGLTVNAKLNIDSKLLKEVE